MAVNYVIPINHAANFSDNVSNVSITVSGALDIGTAMGVMGLTYGVLKYTTFSLMVMTKEGQSIGITLNANQ